jgi:DNA-binding response OmpR family regulator
MLTIGDGRERCAGSLGMTEQILRFGPFELRPSREQLLMKGQPVSLGSRAIAILTLLAQRAGAVISAREITDHVWPIVLRPSEHGAHPFSVAPRRAGRFTRSR